MEICPCSLKFLEGGVSMTFKVGIIDEIEGCSDHRDDCPICSASNDTKEDLFQFLVLLACPLTHKRNPLLKVMEGRVPGHHLELVINLILSGNSLASPF